MFGPTSWFFLGLLVSGVLALMVWLARAGNVVLKIVAGVLAFAVSALFGAALVNQYYAYYTTWGSMFANASGSGVVGYNRNLAGDPVGGRRSGWCGQTRSVRAAQLVAPGRGRTPYPPPRQFGVQQPVPFSAPASPTPSPLPSSTVAASIAIPRLPFAATATKGGGRVVELALTGAQSGISRKGFVYLPPQYFEPAYAQTRFPVLELLHGDPGAATGWVYALNVPGLMDHEINAGRLGPMIIVMPATFSGAHGQDCLDAPAGQLDGTYLATDVPSDIVRDFRALPPGPNWAIGGLSDGGFCAANLALQHRGSYGAVASLDGFYSAYSDLAVMDKVFGAGSPSIQANDPSTLVLDVQQSLPRFWIMSGSGNMTDTKAAQYFRQLVTAREPIQYVVVNHGKHTPPAWRVALPSLLEWTWHTISGGTVGIGTAQLGVPVQPSPGPSPALSLASRATPSFTPTGTRMRPCSVASGRDLRARPTPT